MTSDIRASYDVAAASYAKLLGGFLAENPYDRAMLDLFAGLVTGRVGDLGCGPGRITPYLAARGLDVFGIDLSPGMVAEARKACPDLTFEVGTLLDLDLPDNGLGGALAWYSLVHTPPEELPTVFAEIHRVLAPGGVLLHAFKIGTEGYHLDQAYGHPLSLDVYQYQPAEITALLISAGFSEVATFTHAPLESEKQPQGYVLVRKP